MDDPTQMTAVMTASFYKHLVAEGIEPETAVRLTIGWLAAQLHEALRPKESADPIFKLFQP